MRLIDADALEYHEIDEIGGEYNPYLGCSKEYIDRQPTIAVLEQIRNAIECEADYQDAYVNADIAKGMYLALEIFDKYKGGDNK